MHVFTTFTAIQAWTIRTWNDRAQIRRNLAVAATHIVAVIAAFQVAFPELHLEDTALLTTITRVLTGAGVWLGSKAVLRLVGDREG